MIYVYGLCLHRSKHVIPLSIVLFNLYNICSRLLINLLVFVVYTAAGLNRTFYLFYVDLSLGLFTLRT